MTNDKPLIPLEEAEHEVMLTSRRIALLHLAFAKTLVAEFGEERGMELIVKAIKAYGTRVGEEAREAVLAQGLELTPENFSGGAARGLPKFGMHTGRENIEVNGEHRFRAFGCVMGKVWNELGEGKLGRLYCLVDPAKFMAYNPHYKLAHAKSLPDGDACCEFCIRKTSDQEKRDFASDDADWTYIDQCG
ncbi:L-2-amino-thiazoline-4-carboxylic acid hydrolase [Candidatus Bipolaricaulota bacterium]